MSDGDGHEPEPAPLPLAQTNAQRITELEEIVEEQAAAIEELRQDVTQLTLAVEDDRADADYHDLSRDDKIRRVQETAYEWARNRGGHAALDYKDIRDAIFAGRPAPSHCYNLMEWAAERAGFEYENGDAGHRLTVKTEAVERAVFTGEKRNTEGVGAQ